MCGKVSEERETRVGSDNYANRLKKLEWDCLVLHMVKRSLEFTFRLVSGLVPSAPPLFRPLEARLPLSTVAGNTRLAGRFQVHNCLIDAVGSSFCGIDFPESANSFTNRMPDLCIALRPDSAYATVMQFPCSSADGQMEGTTLDAQIRGRCPYCRYESNA